MNIYFNNIINVINMNIIIIIMNIIIVRKIQIDLFSHYFKDKNSQIQNKIFFTK